MTTVEIVLHGKKVQIERLPDGRFKKPDFVKEMMQYGTSLKPAFEPVVVCRAPRDKRTYAALTREFGTGALAIDAARIGTTDDLSGGTYGGVFSGSRNEDGSLKKAIGSGDRGRWPANFGLVCACEGDDHAANCPVITLGDAARFFYQAKAAAWERHWPVKSNHPTVKPIRLAEYLARLILPPELDTPRRLLVPFAGSGSEMIGARLAGWDVVTGIERESEYVALAEARLAWWAQFASYDDARAAYEKERKAKPALVVIEDKPEQIALFPADEEAS